MMTKKMMILVTVMAIVVSSHVGLGRDGYVRWQDQDTIHSTWSYRPAEHEVRQHLQNGVDLVWENLGEEGALHRVIRSGAKH